MSNKRAFDITIINNQGQLIEKKTEIKKNNYSLDLTKLNARLYFIKIESKGIEEIKKLVI